jgi:hypothetical protein
MEPVTFNEEPYTDSLYVVKLEVTNTGDEPVTVAFCKTAQYGVVLPTHGSGSFQTTRVVPPGGTLVVHDVYPSTAYVIEE